MTHITSKQIILKQWPVGIPTREDFQIDTVDVPGPADGEVLVKNLYMSVDPYMRGRLRPGKSYTEAFTIGSPLNGGCVGVVEESRAPGIEAGKHVLTGNGFREAFTASAEHVKVFDPGTFSASAYLGILGMPGRTAYAGLLEIGRPEPGETVFVSGAAGAVGSAVCQIAKIHGCRVVGSAGSKEKVDWLMNTAGVDAAFNYKDYKNLIRELRRNCPDGIDVYFDNVGGDHLEAAIANMNNFGRIAACGMISQYNNTEAAPGPSNMVLFVGKRLRMQGFIVSDLQADNFESDMKDWIRGGQIKWEETVIDGLDHAVDALIGLFEGTNLGKMVVRL